MLRTFEAFKPKKLQTSEGCIEFDVLIKRVFNCSNLFVGSHFALDKHSEWGLD